MNHSGVSTSKTVALKAGKEERDFNVSEFNKADESEFFGPEAFTSSIQQRGDSFIRAAILMLSHTEDTEMSGPEKQKNINTLEDLKQKFKGESVGALQTLLLEEIFPKIDSLVKPKGDREKLSKSLANAENHVNWGNRDVVETVVQIDPNIIQVRVDTPITRLTKEQEKQWLAILNDNITDPRPNWFTKLAPWEQNYFTKKLKEWHKKPAEERENLGVFMGTPPTTIRGYPGARNGYVTDIYTFKKKEGSSEFEKTPFSYVTKVRSGHISPSKMKNTKERREAAKANLEQLILEGIKKDLEKNPLKKEFFVHLQTLITPPISAVDQEMDSDRLWVINKLRAEFSEPDGFKKFLAKNKEFFDGIELENPTIALITSNHSVNKMRVASDFLAPFVEPFIKGKTGKRSEENDETIEFLRKKSEALKARPPLSNEQEMAHKAVQRIIMMNQKVNTLAQLSNSGINFNAERAALEQIAVSGLGGIRIGSCMSGKDREAAVSQHVAAMSAFYAKYAELPPMTREENKERREEYETMVAKEFLACHDQKIAEANARGAKGMKSAADVLGENIAEKAHEIMKERHADKKDTANQQHWETAPDDMSHKMAKLNRVKVPIKETTDKRVLFGFSALRKSKRETRLPGEEPLVQQAPDRSSPNRPE